MPRIPKTFAFIAVLLWLPFLGVFFPFTFMPEDRDPWYAGYSSFLFLASHLYYYPANYVSQLFASADYYFFLGAAFVQSALLTWLLWILFRSRWRQV